MPDGADDESAEDRHNLKMLPWLHQPQVDIIFQPFVHRNVPCPKEILHVIRKFDVPHADGLHSGELGLLY